MNKSEVLEIRRQFSVERCTIDRIAGCYVDYDKRIRFTSLEAFGSLPDEEMFKYLDIFKHVLTGTFGRNLIPLEFPYDQEGEGGTQEFLLKLRDSGLKDESLLAEFYDRIIANYVNGENYYIILVHASYDVPGITKDGFELEDASENVYEYVLCAICPVTLSAAALGYHEDTNSISDRFRDWVVEGPVKGFLFPAFIDRTADIHNMLYFTKKPEDLQPDFVEALFGGIPPMSAPEQKEGFRELLRETLGDEGDLAVMQNLHENLEQRRTDHMESGERDALTLDKEDVRVLLRDSGVTGEQLEDFDTRFMEAFNREDYPLLADNMLHSSKFELKTPDIVIKINPDRADLVSTRIIDGRKCLVIRVDEHIEVNGVDVHTL